MKLRTLLGSGFALTLLVALGMYMPLTLTKMHTTINEAEARELNSLFDLVETTLAAESRLATSMATFVANIPDIQQGFNAGDRDKLGSMLHPAFKILKQQYGVRQFQFHEPPATSFLRVHKLEKFGDDLSSFRHTVTATNNSKQAVSGLEKGVAGLGVRGVVPVSHAGEHIGSVEFGMSFGQPFFDNFKQQYGVDASLQLAQDGKFTNFASTFGEIALLDAVQLRKVYEGEDWKTSSNVNNKPVAVMARAVKDYSGNPIGVLTLAMDNSYYLQTMAETREQSFKVAALTLLMGGLITWFIASRVTRKLGCEPGDIARIAEAVSSGNLDVDFSSIKCRNSGAFAAVRRMTEELRQIIHGVDSKVIEVRATADTLNALSTDLSTRANDVKNGAERVLLSSGEMHDNLQEISVAARDGASNINNVAAAAETMTGNMHTATTTARHVDDSLRDVSAASKRANEKLAQVRNSAQRTAESTITVASAVEELSSSLNEVRRRCNKADKESRNATNRADESITQVAQLQISADEIGKIVDVISTIADQTNMLALNAAIEAAGAGEAGKSFAVVANEVKDLARMTAEATDQITSQIETIQKNTGSVNTISKELAGAIRSIGDDNNQILHAVEEQSLTLDQIANAMNQVSTDSSTVTSQVSESSNDLDGLSNSVSELSSGISAVTQNVSEAHSSIRQISQQVAESSARIKEISEKVVHTASNSSGIVEEMEAFSTNSVQMVCNGKTVNEKAETMAGVAMELDSTMSHFSVDEQNVA